MRMHRWLALGLAMGLVPACGGGGGGGGGGATPAADALVLMTGNRIAAFNSAGPSSLDAPTFVVVSSGDELVAIAQRPQNGFYYALGYSPTSKSLQLFALHPGPSSVFGVGGTGSFVDGIGAFVPIGVGSGTRFGMSFNPATDRIRVVTSSGQNFRINPNTGAFVDGDLGGGGGAVAGLNQDGPVTGVPTGLQGATYTNSAPNSTLTTLYTLDQTTDALFIQNPPNSGIQTNFQILTPTIDFLLGFDIPRGVNTLASNTPVASGSALAIVRLTGEPQEVVAQLDLTNGLLSNTRAIGTGGIISLGLQKQDSTPMVALLSTGSLTRFSSASPGTTTTVAITGIVAGESLVGMDYRPANGQLFALGINAAANTGSLYTLDPQTGASTLVGIASQVAFVDAASNPVDLPLESSGWGVNFNPVTNQIRVVTSTGLNFRVNANNGAPIDGDQGGAAGSIAGINPDGAVNGAVASLVGAAYTNSNGTLITVTTLYTLASSTGALYIQNPPNNGTQTLPLPILLGGAPLVFTAETGFDIPAELAVGVTNAPVTQGSAWAALTVGGSTHLYSINLATGAATDLGGIGPGTTTVRGLATGRIAVR